VSPQRSGIASNIRQLIVDGKSKTALDNAKEFHKEQRSAESEILLIDAYLARIQALFDQNLVVEAKSLIALVRERFPSAKERLDIRIQAEALYGKAWSLLLLGRPRELPACIQELDMLRSAQMKIGGWHRKQDVYSLYALLETSNGEFAQAAEHAGKAQAASRGGHQPNDVLIQSAILEVQLRLLRNALNGAPDNSAPQLTLSAADAAVRDSMKRLRSFCRVFPIGRPLLHLRQGEFEWIKGHGAAAIKHCELALKAARNLKSEYYQALAHRDLAIYLNADNPDRNGHLREAESIFVKLGAARDLARLQCDAKATEMN